MESGIALFGGSFDPVHIGHLFIVEEVRAALAIEQVFFVPAYQPPHKSEAPQASAEARILMLERALEDRPGCSFLDWEIHRGGVSYTIDTVELVRQKYPRKAKPKLIIGDDLCADFGSWRQSERLLELVELVIVTRGGSVESDTIKEYHLIDNSPLPVSSSDIRERIAEGRNYRDLVPPAVYHFIEENGLYRSSFAVDSIPGE